MNDDQIRSALTKGPPPVPDPAFVDRLEGRLVAELAEPGRRGRPRLQALVAVATAVVFLLAGGYLLRPQPSVDEPATPSLLEPPTPPSSTLPTTVPETVTSTSTLVANWPGQVSGALPDGTPFVVFADEPLVVQGIEAAIVLDRPDGTSPVIGISRFSRAGSADGGEWEFTVDLYDDIRAELGGAVDDMIELSHVNGFPVLDLTPPLRFATDDEVPLHMAVQFEEFSVMHGCGPMAWRCSDWGAVQIVPIDGVVAPAEQPDLTDVWIRSSVPRPMTDRSYVDPGPLDFRIGPLTVWTGTEMLIYGGQTEGEGRRTDGAAYDAGTQTWRTIAPAPEGAGSTIGVWTGDELVVISSLTTVAYDPAQDRWRTVADAPLGLDWTTSFDGSGVVAWSGAGVERLALGADAWEQLPAVPFTTDGSWARQLHVVDGALYAIALEQPCRSHRIAVLEEGTWRELPTVSLASDGYAQCNLPRDSAVVDGRLLVWETTPGLAMAFDPSTGTWTEIDPIPLGGCNGGTSNVVVGDLLVVESCGDAALFDTRSSTWSQLALPGPIESTAVWTGSEVLAWVGLTPPDAWRWTPPS
ncbi:MAG: hypothetical protein ACFCVC_02730 [Acidimicrobiia bacterium]